MACPSLCESIPFILLLLLFRVSKADLTFTMKPSNPTYIINGSTAKLEWDYSDPHQELQSIIFSVEVDGVKEKEFKRMLVKQNGAVQEHGDLPPVYQGRVKIEGNATLVIEKITAQDNTEFKCELLGIKGDRRSLIQLIVAGKARSKFTKDGVTASQVGQKINMKCDEAQHPLRMSFFFQSGVKLSY